jgi:hypothetical protein
VIVRLDLERDGDTIADRDDARVLTRSLEDVWRGGGERTEDALRVLVRAVLVPEGADDAELGEGRFAAEHRDETLVLFGGQPVLGDQRRSDARVAGA